MQDGWLTHRPICEAQTPHASTISISLWSPNSDDSVARRAWQRLSQWKKYQNADIKLSLLSAMKVAEKRTTGEWKTRVLAVVLNYEEKSEDIWEMFEYDSAMAIHWRDVHWMMGDSGYRPARDEEEKRMQGTAGFLGIGTVLFICQDSRGVGLRVRGKKVDSILLIPVFEDDLDLPIDPEWEDKLKTNLSKNRTVYSSYFCSGFWGWILRSW
jgi:hypothetical protein